MKKVYSARKRLVRYFSFLFVATLVLLLLFGVYAYWTYDRQLRYCADAALGIQRSRLVSETDRLTAFGQRLIGSSLEFRRLASSSLDEYTAISLLYQVQNMMVSAVPDAGLLLVCDDSGRILRYEYGTDVLGLNSFLETRHIEAAHLLRDRCLEEADPVPGKWFVLEYDTFAFLYSVQQYQGLHICSALELNAFTREIESSAQEGLQLFFDRDGRFITSQELALSKGLAPENPHDFRRFFREDVFIHEDIPSLGIGLDTLMPLGTVWQFSRISLLVLAVLATLCGVVFLLTYRMMNRIVIWPLQQISALSRQMSDIGEEGVPRLQGSESIEELNTLRESLNQLAGQKVILRKKRDDEETEKEHALLQYYQLQTRSHFFLNCLKSLYSMLETRDLARMQEMIIAFSNHLRFVFHDNLALVPLQAELDEVRDYHRIISMDSRQPLILTQEIAPDALDCLVPPLIIQTFLENSYKYNGRGREVLRFDIRIDRLDYEGQPRLRIRLSDDGLGYPPEMLKELNSPVVPGVFEQYHIGTRNLRRRMGILFSGDDELAFFNGPAGGANVLISIPFRTKGEEEA